MRLVTSGICRGRHQKTLTWLSPKHGLDSSRISHGREKKRWGHSTILLSVRARNNASWCGNYLVCIQISPTCYYVHSFKFATTTEKACGNWTHCEWYICNMWLVQTFGPSLKHRCADLLRPWAIWIRRVGKAKFVFVYCYKDNK